MSSLLDPGISEPLFAFMRLYERVFHPLPYVAAVGLVAIVVEWRREDDGWRGLGYRFGAYATALAAAVTPAAAYLLVTPTGISTALVDPSWRLDLATALGVAAGAGLLWALWTANGWGRIVPDAAALLLLALLPYAAIAPFWDLSGHVTFTTVPTLFLLLVDRRFGPLLVVPAVMVVNRPLLGAHTWLQSVAGVAFAVAVIAVARRTVLDCEAYA
ncbi:phosphoesterase [Halomarina pelagica]|uniref:phosphoesterase n=1 Tax=Halomarina pelagica TaxID=2961599 RepID=UPI0020C41FBA|nr:phosphoesterase [Halomarina sp. BND7]